MSTPSIDQLFADIQAQTEGNRLPPVDKWHPPLSGDIDIVIEKSGAWLHEGDLIARPALVRLFASILRREGDEYFLVTPVEKWRIQVRDAPLLVTTVDAIRREGQQALLFSTATGDQVIAGPNHPLQVTHDRESGEPSPYLMVRAGLQGRLQRNVFYQLAAIAEQADPDGPYGVWSLGEFFALE